MINVKKHNRLNELFLIKSIIQTPEVLSELYFLEAKHFNEFEREFDFVKTRFWDIGEVSLTDLNLAGFELPATPTEYDVLDVEKPKYSLDHNKIIYLAKSLFDEYLKKQILKKIKNINIEMNIDDIQAELNQIISNVDLEYQKNKIEDNFIDVAEKVFIAANEHRNKNSDYGIQLKTLPSMNQIIGGLVETDLVGIFGKSKSAKSTLAMEMIMDVAVDQGIPSAIFSFEMNQKLVAMKGISMRTGLDINEMRNPTTSKIDDNTFQKYAAETTRTFYNSNLFVIDSVLDEYEIENRVKKLVDSKGVKVVLIDYLLLISSRHKFNSTREELNHLSKFFKRLAQKLKIVIILVSQANEEGRSAESKSLERDSNYFFLVWHLEPGEEARINNQVYRAETDEFIVKCKGIRHAKGNDWFAARFVENRYKEIDVYSRVETKNHTNSFKKKNDQCFEGEVFPY